MVAGDGGSLLLKVDPATGAIERLNDMSIDNAEHGPIVAARSGDGFQVGTFGEDGGPAELAAFGPDVAPYTRPFQSLQPIVGMACQGARLHSVEFFPHDQARTPNNADIVAFDPATGKGKALAQMFANLPNGLVTGPRRRALHVQHHHERRARRRQRAAHRPVKQHRQE